MRVLHLSWKTNKVPSMFIRKVASFVGCLPPDWEIRLYDNDDNRLLYQKAFPERFVNMFDRYPKNISRADISRIGYMAVYGGMYVDLDYICLRNPMEAFPEGMTSQVGRGLTSTISGIISRLHVAPYASR